MNTRSTTARSVEEVVVNAVATTQGNRVPSQEQFVVNDQFPGDPPAMKDGEVRETLLQMAQSITKIYYDTS